MKSDLESKRQIALDRAKELKERIRDYLDIRDSIPSGRYMSEEFQENRARIMKLLGASEDQWNDWRWQMRNRISKTSILKKIINLTDQEVNEIDAVGRRYRWAISPYYASLISHDDRRCPIFMQSVPSILEESERGKVDPMAEEMTSPVESITRRYPDRLIIKVTNQCPMYCRHCQRRRNIGEVDKNIDRDVLIDAIDYVKENSEIRDVLITGGDALMLRNSAIDWLLGEIRKIPHVEIVRLGTRTLATLPQRITEDLCRILEKYHPLYINTQFNHPKEITEETLAACNRLTKAGIPLGNQAVLLKGINNNPHVMKRLNHELLKARIRPYYIFHAKSVKGTTHFKCRVEEGIEIMESLRGFTSGLAIPTFIVNAPGGYGKTPMLPEYLISQGKGKILLRTWENKVIEYSDYDGEGP